MLPDVIEICHVSWNTFARDCKSRSGIVVIRGHLDRQHANCNCSGWHGKQDQWRRGGTESLRGNSLRMGTWQNGYMSGREGGEEMLSKSWGYLTIKIESFLDYFCRDKFLLCPFMYVYWCQLSCVRLVCLYFMHNNYDFTVSLIHSKMCPLPAEGGGQEEKSRLVVKIGKTITITRIAAT